MRITGVKITNHHSMNIFNRVFQMCLFASILCLILSYPSPAQQNISTSIQGKVIDKETGESLRYTNVFLANTTIGTTTDKNGEFIINRVPPGTYDLIFSYVGYETQRRHIQTYKPETFSYTISLVPKPLTISPVEIIGTVPKNWKKNLKIFTNIFLGETDNSEKTRILNPEVLNLIEVEYSEVLKASSDSLLKIENRSLGYLIEVILESFSYDQSNSSIKYVTYSRFQELIPKSKKEKARWEENRRKAYVNSPRYFFYQLVQKQLHENKFYLYKGSLDQLLNETGDKIVEKDLLLTANSDSTIYTLHFPGSLKIIHNFKTSVFTFYKPTTEIDRYGYFLKSFYTIEIYGYWSKQGIADTLPKNYVYTED